MANVITLGRMALVAPLVVLFLINAPWNMIAAFAVFALASATDFIDGQVARARNEESALGAALDPIADKLLVAAALILLARNGLIGEIGVIAVVVIILREILVSGLREAVAAKNGALPVTTLAKWKTAAQLVAAGLLLAAAPHGVIGEAARPYGIGALWFAAMLTLWTGADYAVRAARFLNNR